MNLQQLPLAIGWRHVPAFDTFSPGENSLVLDAVRTLALSNGTPVLIYGGAGSGKTHLLQAATRTAHQAGRRSAYLPLGDGGNLSPEVTDGLDDISVLALDECESICMDRRWAEALIRLIDHRNLAGGGLLLACRLAPTALSSRMLPDLRSRLSAFTVFHLKPLADADRRDALQRHANALGLRLDDNTADFMIHRLPRDLPSLVAALERLSVASLGTQRRLTVPFVQQFLLVQNARESPNV